VFPRWIIGNSRSQETRSTLQIHEDSIQGNQISILTSIVKIYEHDNNDTSQITTIIESLVKYKLYINVLEEECSMQFDHG
jgi:hypothetical protein